jgi:hypothetical protein
LEPPAGFNKLVSVGVDPAGPIALWASTNATRTVEERALVPGIGGVEESQKTGEPAVAVATYFESTLPTTWTAVDAVPALVSTVQRFPNENFLVAGARSEWRPAGPDLNAFVIAPDGSVIRRGCLGDGIQDVQVDSDGLIWVAYFDEGIFGWGPPGPPPLGAAGIAAWSSSFEKVWELKLEPGAGEVVDCNALNVASNAVWASIADLPVVRIADGRPHAFAAGEMISARGILADGDRAALIGTVADPSVLVTGLLDGNRYIETDRRNLWTPDGRPLPQSQVHCRGSVAHFFAGADWFTFDLQSLA